MNKNLTEGMADMKLSGAERNRTASPSAYETPPYPWGLSIRLENDALEKLGIKSLPAPGECFVIHAVADVESSSESKSKDNEGDRAVQLQITHMKVTRHHGAK